MWFVSAHGDLTAGASMLMNPGVFVYFTRPTDPLSRDGNLHDNSDSSFSLTKAMNLLGYSRFTRASYVETELGNYGPVLPWENHILKGCWFCPLLYT